MDMVEELRRYPHFFNHIQLDTYWIVCLIHDNPDVECLVRRIERSLEWGADIRNFTFKEMQESEIEFFELIDGNGFKIATEPTSLCYGIRIKIETM